MAFCGLHNHTEYSNTKLRDCIIRTKDLVAKAIEYGYKGIAITDHEVLSGHVQALGVQDKLKETNPDFKLMLGNEIYLIDQKDWDEDTVGKYFHCILIAKDLEGYNQLKTLSSRAWSRAITKRGQMRTPTFYQDLREIVGANKGHLVCSSACLGGEVAHAIINGDNEAINRFIPMMVEIFGQDNFFLEMQDSDSEEQVKVNNTIVRLSEYFKIDYIVTSDAHYLNKEDISIHSAFLNSKSENDRETESFYKHTYVKTLEEIKQILSYLSSEVVDRAIANTMKIYDMVEPFDFRHPVIVPCQKPTQFELSHSLKEFYKECEYIKKYAYDQEEQNRYLIYLIEQGIKDKNVTMDLEKAKRIDIELDTLWCNSIGVGQPMSAYLNLVKGIIDTIWETSLVGISRGSAMCFYINYLIDITQASPIQYDIPYWRFFNKATIVTNEKGEIVGATIPDIDIDVDPTQMKNILAKLRERYGADNVLNCLTFKTETTKSAILTACRGLGIPLDEAQNISAQVTVTRGQVASFDACLYGDESKGISPVSGFKELIGTYPNLENVVRNIEGITSGRGIHASAYYVFNKGYLEQNSLMKAPNGALITAFNMNDSDALGGLKVDILSTKLQTKFARCLSLLLNSKMIEWQGSLRKTYTKYMHPDVLDYENPKMWEQIEKNAIMDLFQFEGQVGQVCVAKTKPKTVSQMGLSNALMRLMTEKGNESLMDKYIRYKENINIWYQEMQDFGLNEEEIGIMKKHLLKNFGVSAEQEDLMMLLMDEGISGFSLAESNQARKAVSKKKTKEIAALKEKVYRNCEERLI